MILDGAKGDGEGYTIFDAATGRCLDGDRLFYVDSDRGFYKHYLANPDGRTFVWDRRTKTPATRDTPEKFREMAWELVRRPVAIFRKEESQLS